MNKDRLRKILVIAFLIWGMFGIVYEFNQPKPVVIEGTGSGFNDDLQVTLTLHPQDDGYKIIGVEVKHNDTPMIADPASQELINQILTKQTHDVDEVSGATYTSQGVKEATEDALTKINN